MSYNPRRRPQNRAARRRQARGARGRSAPRQGSNRTLLLVLGLFVLILVAVLAFNIYNLR